MNNCSVFLLVAIALVFTAECNDVEEHDLEPIVPIDPDQIVIEILNTSYGIIVKWWLINSDRDCFTTEVQYKRQCAKDWKSNELEQHDEVGYLNLSTVSMKMNYDFRIRMNYWCLDHPWSNWTKIQRWGNNTDFCMTDSSSYLWVYILIPVLALTIFLLFCLLTQQGVRKLILPEVPDPKHLKSKIMDTDQSQWWGNLSQRNDDCTTIDIEIIEKSERKEQRRTLVIQPFQTISEQHDNTYSIYSPETSLENMEVDLCENVLGYISL